MADDDSMDPAEARRRLMHQLEVERNQLVRNVEACRIRDIERAFVGEWSLKDVVGHVSSWEAEVVTAVRELRQGKRPALLEFDQSQIDRWNRDHVERKRDLSFWNVLEQLRGGRASLVAEIDGVEDQDLVAEGSVFGRLVHSVIDHDRVHWHEIAARLAGMAGARHTGPVSIPEEAASTD